MSLNFEIEVFGGMAPPAMTSRTASTAAAVACRCRTSSMLSAVGMPIRRCLAIMSISSMLMQRSPCARRPCFNQARRLLITSETPGSGRTRSRKAGRSLIHSAQAGFTIAAVVTAGEPLGAVAPVGGFDCGGVERSIGDGGG